MAKIAELTGHTARVLHMALSPDGTTVLSASADESLRFWKVFEPKVRTHTKKVIFFIRILSFLIRPGCPCAQFV